MRTSCSILLVSIALLLLSPGFSFQMHSLDNENMEKEQNSEFDGAYIIHRDYTMQLVLKDRIVKLMNVPDVMQATDYTCGPSSLEAVLNYFHIVAREQELAKKAETSNQYGTFPEKLF